MTKKYNVTGVKRKKIHHRKIDLECFSREDGNFDIEAKIIDKKPYETISNYEINREANSPIHDMMLRITVSIDFIILNVEAVMFTPAHESCHPATDKYNDLIGIKIGPGWLKEAKKKIPMNMGCTHLSELLQQIGTTAFQGILGLDLDASIKYKEKKSFSSNFIDTCFGLRKGGVLDKKRNTIS